LNDVLSLLVALWAIKLAKAKSSNDYTYGWQRAEVLGALINGVFLLALCFTIFLEAVQRFFEPQGIRNPWLVLGVGSAGLASNIIGLFLFHDHGHSHGDAEAGAHSHDHAAIDSDEEIRQDIGDIDRIMPDSYVRRVARSTSPSRGRVRTRMGSGRGRQTHFASPETDIHVHPALNRQEVVRAAASDSAISESETDSDENTPLVSNEAGSLHEHSAGWHKRGESLSWHRDHNHTKPKKSKGGHSHQNLNMRGVFLHVLGDALGNVGVILTALFVRFSPNYKFTRPFTNYADPFISLVITIIIFLSALPLVKSASKILLQGVPKGIALDEVKEDVASIPGVESVHELHVWQLSDVKMIASLHIQIKFDPETDGGQKYMRLAKAIRTCMHAFGIHSVTIQPEYDASAGSGRSSDCGYGAVETGSPEACLLECGEECGSGKCCAPVDESMVGNSSHSH
jgi:zinc transporter 1